MRSSRRSWVAALAAIGLAVVAVSAWWMAMGSRTASAPDSALVAPRRAAPPAPGVPAPRDAEPLVAVTSDPAPVASAPAESAAQPAASEPARAGLCVLVEDPLGRPVEGAEVTVSRGQPPRRGTDAEGVARFDAAAGETVRLVARHEDWRLATANATLAPEAGRITEVRLRLGDGLQACLTVRSRDGHPIEGASVRVGEGWGRTDSKDVLIGSARDLQRSDDRRRLDGEVQETRRTDAQGGCCLRGLRPGPLTIRVDAPGFVPLRSSRFELDQDGGDLGVIELQPAQQVAGSVVDAAGPVPGALVEVLTPLYARTRTDESGGFTLDGLAALPALVSLRASCAGRGHFHAERLEIVASPVQVRLVPDLDVRLELRDALTQAPIDGQGTLERRHAGRGVFMLLPSSEAVVVSAGRLDVLGLPYYLAELALALPGYDELVVPLSVLAADADGVLQFDLTRPTLLLVRVRDAVTGRPLEDARLHLGQVFRNARDGRVSRNVLLAGPRFDAQAGGYLVAESELQVGSGDDISLAATAPGHAPSTALPIASAGRRTCPATLDLYLDPTPAPAGEGW